MAIAFEQFLTCCSLGPCCSLVFAALSTALCSFYRSVKPLSDPGNFYPLTMVVGGSCTAHCSMGSLQPVVYAQGVRSYNMTSELFRSTCCITCVRTIESQKSRQFQSVCVGVYVVSTCLFMLKKEKKKTLRQKPSKSTLFIFVGENSKRYENKYWSLSIRVFFVQLQRQQNSILCQAKVFLFGCFQSNCHLNENSVGIFSYQM